MHMLFGAETKRQQLGQGDGLKGAVCPHHMDPEIIVAELPHHLTAEPAT